MRRLTLTVVCLFASTGCAHELKIKDGCWRTIATGPVSFPREGETFDGTRQGVMRFMPPSLIIPLDDGEVFVWRGEGIFSKHGPPRCDTVMSFDADGKFMKTDPELLKAYCTICWTDVGRFTGTQCPRCEHKLPEDRKLDVAHEGVPCERAICELCQPYLAPKSKVPKLDAPD